MSNVMMVAPLFHPAATLEVIERVLSGELPDAALMPFLHEATHNWCFTGCVFRTLALLQMRARRWAFAESGDVLTDVQQVFDELAAAVDVIVCESAHALLRPLAEGLALFVEFDDEPGLTPIESSPLMAAGPLWGKTQRLSACPVGDPFIEKLRLIRRGEFGMGRKRRLLREESFDCGHGGYLPGYMTVRNLWLYAKRQSQSLRDASAFSSYFRQYFFDDFGLVTVLLKRRQIHEDAAAEIQAYLAKRIQEFVFDDHEARFRNWLDEIQKIGSRGIQAVRHPAPDYHGGLQSMADVHDGVTDCFNPPDVSDMGHRLMDALSNDVLSADESKPDSKRSQMAWLHRRLFQLHELLWIASCNAVIQISGTRVTVAEDRRELFSCDCFGQLEDGQYSGTIAVVASIFGVSALCLIIDNELIGIVGIDELQSGAAQRLRELLLHPDIVQEGERKFGDLLEISFSDTARVAIDLARARNQQRANSVYQKCALGLPRIISTSRVDKLAELLQQKGFIGLVASNELLLDVVRVISTASSTHQSAEACRQRLKELPGYSEQRLTELDTLSTELIGAKMAGVNEQGPWSLW